MNTDSLKKLAKELSADFIEYSADDSDVKELREFSKPYYPEKDSDNIPWEDFGYTLFLIFSLYRC